jgi:hypothetical protein
MHSRAKDSQGFRVSACVRGERAHGVDERARARREMAKNSPRLYENKKDRNLFITQGGRVSACSVANVYDLNLSRAVFTKSTKSWAPTKTKSTVTTETKGTERRDSYLLSDSLTCSRFDPRALCGVADAWYEGPPTTTVEGQQQSCAWRTQPCARLSSARADTRHRSNSRFCTNCMT